MDKKPATKKPSLDLGSLIGPLQQVALQIKQRLTFIIILLVAGLLLYSVLLVSSTLSLATDEAYREEQLGKRINSSFDKETIDKIDNLTISSESSSIALPAGRRNPFTD